MPDVLDEGGALKTERTPPRTRQSVRERVHSCLCSSYCCLALLYVTLLASVLIMEAAFSYPALLGDERAVSDRWLRFDISPTASGFASISDCEEHCIEHLQERSSSISFKAALDCETTVTDQNVRPLRTSSARVFRPLVDPYLLRGLTMGNFDRARNVSVLLCSTSVNHTVDADELQAHAWRLLQ
jgi:hypothetical protein